MTSSASLIIGLLIRVMCPFIPASRICFIVSILESENIGLILEMLDTSFGIELNPFVTTESMIPLSLHNCCTSLVLCSIASALITSLGYLFIGYLLTLLTTFLIIQQNHPSQNQKYIKLYTAKPQTKM